MSRLRHVFNLVSNQARVEEASLGAGHQLDKLRDADLLARIIHDRLPADAVLDLDRALLPLARVLAEQVLVAVDLDASVVAVAVFLVGKAFVLFRVVRVFFRSGHDAETHGLVELDAEAWLGIAEIGIS